MTENEQSRRTRGSRPGAMTMAMEAVQTRPSGPKVLRIGLIQGGKIVEERIIRKRETVTVGASEKNHFVIQAQGLSSRFELFQLVGNDYILNFTDQMRGRVGLAAGVKELDELRKSGARKAQGYYQVKLTESSRGKVVIGDTTLLFQFVTPPPVQPRPQLPATVVGGLAAGIDWLFTAFVMFSFMTHFGFVIYLENSDWPIEPTVAVIPPHVAEMIFPEPPTPQTPPPVDPTDVDDVDEVEEEVVVEAPRQATPSSGRGSSSGGSSGPSSGSGSGGGDADARLATEQARQQVEQLLIGAFGAGGATADLLREGAATGSSQDLMAQAQGVSVASGDGAGTLRERSGGGEVGGGGGGDLGSLQARTSAGQQQQEGRQQVVERVIRGTANVGALEDESGAGLFDSNLVVRQLRSRQAAVRRCYERELRNNPTLGGRVVVRFSVQPTGTISNVTTTENTTGSAAVAACVTSVVRGIRFTEGPDGGSVTYTFPFVFAVQN